MGLPTFLKIVCELACRKQETKKHYTCFKGFFQVELAAE